MYLVFSIFLFAVPCAFSSLIRLFALAVGLVRSHCLTFSLLFLHKLHVWVGFIEGVHPLAKELLSDSSVPPGRGTVQQAQVLVLVMNALSSGSRATTAVHNRIGSHVYSLLKRVLFAALDVLFSFL